MSASRLPRLDALRSIAVLLVIGRHAHVPPDGTSPAIVRFMAAWKECGWAGVDLFFVLSGFLVSGLLFREHRRHKEIRVPNFLIRRGLKIYPAFYVYAAFAICLAPVMHLKPSATQVAAELLFVQNYFPGVLWEHTWSLAVEEHFYILLSFLLFLLAVRGRGRANPFRAIVPIFMAVAVACLGLRMAHTFGPRGMYLTHLRIDSLLFGVVLSYLYEFDRTTVRAVAERHGQWIFVAGIVITLQTFFAPTESAWMRTAGFTTMYLAFGGIVLTSVCRDADPAKPIGIVAAALARVGVYSYSIYLWHRLAIDSAHVASKHLLHLPFLVEMALAVVLSVGAGLVTALLIEIPILRLRDRIFPSRSTDARSSGDRGGIRDREDPQDLAPDGS